MAEQFYVIEMVNEVMFSAKDDQTALKEVEEFIAEERAAGREYTKVTLYGLRRYIKTW